MQGDMNNAISKWLGEEEIENAPSSHGSYAPCGVFVMACRLWAQD